MYFKVFFVTIVFSDKWLYYLVEENLTFLWASFGKWPYLWVAMMINLDLSRTHQWISHQTELYLPQLIFTKLSFFLRHPVSNFKQSVMFCLFRATEKVLGLGGIPSSRCQPAQLWLLHLLHWRSNYMDCRRLELRGHLWGWSGKFELPAGQPSWGQLASVGLHWADLFYF